MFNFRVTIIGKQPEVGLHRRGIKIWCWEQEFWSKSLSLGLPFGFLHLILTLESYLTALSLSFPTWGCLHWRWLWEFNGRMHRSWSCCFWMLGGFLRFSPGKILGQEERSPGPLFIYSWGLRQQWFHPIHRAWKWWAAAAGLPPRTLWLLRNQTSEFELSVLLKMQSSTCAERVPGVGVPSPSDNPGA